MYEYRRRNKLGLGSILLIILFTITVLGLLILYFINKGEFWDYLPIVSIVIVILSLLFAIFNMARRANGSFIFIIFFLIFLGGLVLSSLTGPFALNKNAQKAADSGDYNTAIKDYGAIIKTYSTSKYYDDALKNIVSNYYNTGDYKNTIKYLNLGIEKNVTDPENLDIKKMFSDSYSKLAEKAYKNQDYDSASLNYVMAIDILKDISEKFPNSDEAFISNYKIPEYLYKAAKSYKEMGNYDQGIEILKELIKEYPESDYSEESGSLIFNSYIEEILGLVENLKYKEALDKYLSALDLASESGTQIQLDIHDSQIFSKIPEETLLEYAIGICKSGRHERALQIFIFMLNSYPDRTEAINPYYAACKIGIISHGAYEILPEIKELFTIKNQGNFVLNINNKYEKELILYFNGGKGSIFTIKAKSRLDVTLPMGSYDIAAEFSDDALPVFFGHFDFMENKKYSQVFLYEKDSNETAKKESGKTIDTENSTTTNATNETTATQ
ncbi:MAG: tetratricopeptide repeat protein [Actinomycetota bacterium]|nr:tetratricopeptide repeat protein [Actinomycetota bacterium]